MKKIFASRVNEIIISLVGFVFSLIFFHFVTDDYFFFGCSLAAKQFSDYSYLNMQFQGYIGIAEIYQLFYYLMPGINWHFLFMVLFEFIALYLALRTLRLIILRKVNSHYLICAIQILFTIYYLENIVMVSHTRVSLILCGIALFNLAFSIDISKSKALSNIIIFIFGMLLRPESAIGMLMMVGIGYLIYYFDIKKLILRIWVPILSISAFLIVFTIDWHYTDIYIKKLEPEIEYKIMAKRVVDIGQMKNAKDSIKYEAALVGMWFDTKEVTPAFMRSIILPGVDTSAIHMKDVFMHLLGFYSYYLFIPFLFITLMVLSLFLFRDSRTRIIKILVFEICTALIIYALDYNGFLVNHRHFINLQIISLLIISFYFFDVPFYEESRYNKLLVIIALGGLIMISGLTISRYKEENEAIYQESSSMMQTMNKFESIYNNCIVVANIDSRFLFDRHLSVTNDNYTKNTYLMFDWFTFPLTPQYTRYLSQKCRCDAADPVAFFHWLSANHAIYIASPYRCDLTKRYLNIVHGCRVDFGPAIKVNSLTGIKNDETKDDEIRTIQVITP